MIYIFVNEDHIKREKAKVKAAKKSRWWQQKCASGLCHYCGKKYPHRELTMDHVVPLARGGQTTPGNVVPCCQACNKAKGIDTPVDQFFSDKKPSKS